MRKNIFKLLTICSVTILLQNCSKKEYKSIANQQQGNTIANSSGLKLNDIGSTGVYQFMADDGTSAGVANNSTTPGNSFSLTAFSGVPFQKWQITQVTATSFSIRNLGSNLYLQSYNYNGKQVLVQGPYTGTDAQQWNLSNTSGKAYKVINKADGLAITATLNALYQLQPFTNLPSQIWGYNQLTGAAASIIKERRSPVYFGTVDEGPSLPGDGQMAKLSDPANYSQWEYVRTHADGYVQSFIAMDGNNHRSTPLVNLQAMAAAFTNKGCYYSASTEVSVQASGDVENDAVDRQNIDQLIAAGFNVNSATINYGTTTARTATLRTYPGGNRPCLEIWGPWDFGGDINSSHGINATIRGYILATDGISFDSPMGLWFEDYQSMQEGAYSAVAFAHANGKLASIDLAPSPFFGAAGYSPAATHFFPTAKTCVFGFEDHNASLDEWDLYLYQGQGVPIFPEVTVQNGTNVPASTQTGFGYWLIRHLNTLPLMSIPNTGNMGNNTTVTADNTHAQITMDAAGSYSMLINFSNKPDTAIELSPLITANITGNTADWNVTFKIGSTDVTNAILNTGLNCVSPIRLTSKFTLPLTMTVKALKPSASPVTINFVTAANISNTGPKLNYPVVVQTR